MLLFIIVFSWVLLIGSVVAAVAIDSDYLNAIKALILTTGLAGSTMYMICSKNTTMVTFCFTLAVYSIAFHGLTRFSSKNALVANCVLWPWAFVVHNGYFFEVGITTVTIGIIGEVVYRFAKKGTIANQFAYCMRLVGPYGFFRAIYDFEALLEDFCCVLEERPVDYIFSENDLEHALLSAPKQMSFASKEGKESFELLDGKNSICSKKEKVFADEWARLMEAEMKKRFSHKLTARIVDKCYALAASRTGGEVGPWVIVLIKIYWKYSDDFYRIEYDRIPESYRIRRVWQ